jgi:hypothetical protein
MIDIIHDFLIVGSGMSSVHAAQTLVESGKKVTIIDVGTKSKNKLTINPSENFYNLRSQDKEQYKYLLGENLEGVIWQNPKNHLTPERQYILDGANEFLPYQSENFNLIQSLARGGLGNAWGAGASPYTEDELKAIGLPPLDMQKSYVTISNRIGLSGCFDDADIFFNKKDLKFDDPFKIDYALLGVYNAYTKSKKSFNSKGVYFGKTPLAVISKNKKNRRAYNYRNMDFYDDAGGSVYRPWMTLDELNNSDLFTYIPNALVLKFSEKIDFTEVFYKDLKSGDKRSVKCKVLLLGAGVTSTARIVLRSFDSKEALPILTNGFSTKAFLRVKSIGNPMKDNKNSLGQIEMFYKYNNDPLMTSTASLYTYSSLMLSQLIKETPYLGFSYARKLMAYLQPALVIALINHPDTYTNGNVLKLIKSNHSLTGDKMVINYSRKLMRSTDRHAVNKFTRTLFKTGCIPLAEKQMEPGSAVHYAGTLPFNSTLRKFYLNTDGKLNRTSSVYVIDGSGFKFLPANGISFSLMANADRIARLLIHKGKIG